MADNVVPVNFVQQKRLEILQRQSSSFPDKEVVTPEKKKLLLPATSFNRAQEPDKNVPTGKPQKKTMLDVVGKTSSSSVESLKTPTTPVQSPFNNRATISPVQEKLLERNNSSTLLDQQSGAAAKQPVTHGVDVKKQRELFEKSNSSVGKEKMLSSPRNIGSAVEDANPAAVATSGKVKEMARRETFTSVKEEPSVYGAAARPLIETGVDVKQKKKEILERDNTFVKEKVMLDLNVSVKELRKNFESLSEVKLKTDWTAMEERTVVRAKIVADKLKTGGKKRQPIDCMIAADISGSMQGDSKLELLKETLVYLVNSELMSFDRFGLVVFDDSAETLFPLQCMTESKKIEATTIIRGLCTRGGTNIGRGLFLALDELYGTSDRNKISSILLLTDGETGDDPEQFCAHFSARLAAANDAGGFKFSQPSVFVFGYGQGVGSSTEDLLVAISKTSKGGDYCSVTDPKEIHKAFPKWFAGVSSIAAQSLLLTVRVDDPSVFLDDGMISFTKAKRLAKNELQLVLDDLYMGASRDILFPIDFGKNAPVRLVCMTFTLQYVDMASEKERNIQSNLKFDRQISPMCNHEVIQHVLRVGTCKALDVAKQFADNGDFKNATLGVCNQLDEIAKVSQSYGIRNSPLLNECITDLEQAKNELVDKTTYDAKHTSSFLRAAADSHRVQRSTKLGASYYNTAEMKEATQKALVFWSNAAATEKKVYI